MRDQSGRNIDYLRVSVTDRCNLRCIYCMPESGVPMMSHGEILTLEEIHTLVKVIDSTVGLRKIRVTGGEPLVRRGIVSLVEKLSGLAETLLTTNGMLLPGLAEDLAKAGLSRVNISLDSLDDGVLARVTRRDVSLAEVEKAIAAAVRAGLVPVKINCVVLKGINTGELPDMIRWAANAGVSIRFIEHMPMEGSRCSYFSGDDILGTVGPAEVTGREGTAVYYRTPEGFVFGIIAPVCTDMCSSCNRLRLTAHGRLLPCLAGGEPLDLRSMLRAGAGEGEMKEAVARLVLDKPLKGRCGGVRMWRIGG
jgi:cyclic pyranopterin phosphate synthase